MGDLFASLKRCCNMICADIRSAMETFDACEPTLDGARVATHCLYPSFESVYVYVVKEGDGFLVHDGGGAFQAAWEHSRDEKTVRRSANLEAARYRLELDGDKLATRKVSAAWLASAILAVANASAAAANAAVARAIGVADEELVEKIDLVLSRAVPPNRIARRYVLKGDSGGERHFDFALKGEEGYDLLLSGVSSHHSSYSTKFVSFSDVPIDRTKKLAIRDAILKSDVEVLLSKVATIVPFSSLLASSVRSYADASALH
jgi:hypothetical protein